MQISKSPLSALRPPAPVNKVGQWADEGGSGYTPLASNGHSPVVQAVVGLPPQRGTPLGSGELSEKLSNHEITGVLSAEQTPSAHRRAQALSTYRQLADQTLEPRGGRLVGIDVRA